jgi:hypothetical protein
VYGRCRAWRHYINLASTTAKLDWLLTQFRFGRMADVLEDYFATRPDAVTMPYAPNQAGISECA